MDRIYVAAPGVSVVRARAMAERLAADGFEIASRWHAGSEDRIDDAKLTPRQAEDAHASNLFDLNNATLLVALTEENAGRETYAEIGGAVFRGIPIVWSLEKGGACLSRWATEVPVEVVKRDADVPQIVRAMLRGYRSQRQHVFRGMGSGQ